MRATLVYVHVKPQHLDDFIEATRLNHLGTRQEEGNFQFDLIQDQADPSRFVLYEVFANEEAVMKHKETAHYQLWRDTVEEWMAEPRKGVVHHRVFPEVS